MFTLQTTSLCNNNNNNSNYLQLFAVSYFVSKVICQFETSHNILLHLQTLVPEKE